MILKLLKNDNYWLYKVITLCKIFNIMNIYFFLFIFKMNID